MSTRPVVLVDAMIIIEAVRTGCWNAISGQREIVTVQECADEVRRGDPSRPGYVTVTEDDLARARVEAISDEMRAAFRLEYAVADGLDPGEQDLLALVASRRGEFLLATSDKAAVVGAHALGRLEDLISLEALARSVGVNPNPGLKVQFTEQRLKQWRAALLLGGPM